MSARWLSTSCISAERFGANDGSSGWKWEKGGVGMGGKDLGNYTATLCDTTYSRTPRG